MSVHWTLPLQFLVLCVLSQHSAAAFESRKEFDFFLFARQWPATFCDHAKCKHQPANKTVFTIHGLWPEYADHTWPQNCDPRNKFDASQVQDLMDEMQADWPSFLLASFWAHEWEKHGTCSLSVLPTEHEYFSAALHLHEKYDLEDALAADGIVPSPTALYDLRDILAAFKKGLGTAPQLVCSGGELNEVRMCVSKELEPFDCTHMYRQCPWKVKLPPFPVKGGAAQLPAAQQQQQQQLQAAAAGETQGSGPVTAATNGEDGEDGEDGSDAEGGMMGGDGDDMMGGDGDDMMGGDGEGMHHGEQHGEGGELVDRPQSDDEDRGAMHRPHHADDNDDDDADNTDNADDADDDVDDADNADDADDDVDDADDDVDDADDDVEDADDDVEDADDSTDDAVDADDADDTADALDGGEGSQDAWELAAPGGEHARLLADGAPGPRGHPAAEWFHYALWGKEGGHASPAVVAAVFLAAVLTVGFVVALLSPRARAAAMGGVCQGVACAYAKVASKDVEAGCDGCGAAAGAGGAACPAAVAEAKAGSVAKLEV